MPDRTKRNAAGARPAASRITRPDGRADQNFFVTVIFQVRPSALPVNGS